MSITVPDIDRLIGFAQNQESQLRAKGENWATEMAQRYDRIVQALRELRQGKQMTGMNGQRIDQQALDAIPELEKTKALMLYFETTEDRDAFAEEVKSLIPNIKTIPIDKPN